MSDQFHNWILFFLPYLHLMVIRQGFIFQNNPIYRMDLDLWDCFGRDKTYYIAELHIINFHIVAIL